MTFEYRIDTLYSGNSGDGSYECGFSVAKEQARYIVQDADTYIERLEYYILKMAGDDILQEIKEEVGYE